MGLGLRSKNRQLKNKFTFEVSQGEEVDNQIFHDPRDLVNWADEENIRLSAQNQADQVLITKTNTKGEVFYAQRLVFPLDDHIDIDDLFTNFYEKKAVPFEQDILEHSAVVTVDHEHEEVPEMPKDIEELLQTSQEKHSSPIEEAVGYSTAPEILLSDEQETVEEVDRKLPQFVPASEFEAMKVMFMAQQEEISSLKAQISASPQMSMGGVVQQEYKALASESDVVAIIDPKTKFMEERAEEHVPLYSEHESEDIAVSAILSTVKEKIDQSMKAFIDEETKKMNQEIEALDQRDKIAQEITDFYSKEEKATLQTAKTNHQKAKDSAILKEEERHRKELSSIEIRFEAEYQTQVEAIKAEYAGKIAAKVKEEYDKQTEALERILQGKTDELKLRQRELNEGLKSNFSQAIDQFNHAHEEVIQTVEKQKDASPIEISKYLKTS